MKRLLTWNLAPVGFCAVLLACSNGPPRPPSVSPRFAEFTLPPARSPQAVPSQPPSGSVEPTPFDSATLPVYPKGWFEPIVSYPELAPKEECLHASHCFVDIEATPRGVWLVGGALCAAQPRATDGS